SKASRAEWALRTSLVVHWFVPVITPTARRWQPAQRDAFEHPEIGDSNKEDFNGTCRQAALQVAVLPGHRRDRDRRPPRAFLPGDRRGDETARRWLHQADQDDHRPDYLLHGGRRHRWHGGHEEGRQDRRLCAAVFRNR